MLPCGKADCTSTSLVAKIGSLDYYFLFWLLIYTYSGAYCTGRSSPYSRVEQVSTRVETLDKAFGKLACWDAQMSFLPFPSWHHPRRYLTTSPTHEYPALRAKLPTSTSRAINSISANSVSRAITLTLH